MPKRCKKGRFPVVGFIKDPSGVAALYLGKRQGNDMVCMGKWGTAGRGLFRPNCAKKLDTVAKKLDTVVTPKTKLSKPLKKPRAHGLNRGSLPTLNATTSRRRAC
jgi:bifunctional non-homologous end joining protein LigD